MIIIAGPCQIESEEHALMMASRLKDVVLEKRSIWEDLPNLHEFYYKSSFDKANRTSIDSPRGVGIEEGLEILNKIKKNLDIKICTDIHEPWHAEMCGGVVDMIQIPAFLCRQTDLIVAASENAPVVNIKKGQFMAPWDMQHAVAKVKDAKVMITERGTSFGYNNLVVDMTGIVNMKEMHGDSVDIIFDATHSVQKPGGGAGKSTGKRELTPPLTRAAIATGYVDGLFMEVHEEPQRAPSDGDCMIELNDFRVQLKRYQKIYEMCRHYK